MTNHFEEETKKQLAYIVYMLECYLSEPKDHIDSLYEACVSLADRFHFMEEMQMSMLKRIDALEKDRLNE